MVRTALTTRSTRDPLNQPAGRRPWWVWLTPAAVLGALLLAQNWFLFSTSVHEQGDSAADSILIEQALRLRLLVGHYSRDGFNHPGPAYLYVQAAGQWLFHDVLHVVPTGWNGQILAVIAFSAVFTGFAVLIVYGWTRSVTGGLVTFAVIAALIATHGLVPVSGWPPEMFVLTYVVFTLAAASVAARQSRDLWLLALSAWFLIHGYAPFLFFVPLILVATAVIALWPSRHHVLASVAGFLRGHRGQWIAVLVISVVFLFPIALDLALHWPGEFGKYLHYSESSQAGGHSARQVASFIWWFWGPEPDRAAWLLGCVAVAPFATAFLTRGALRRCLAGAMVMTVLTTLAFVYYAATAADYLSNFYIGYFYWSVPCVFVLIVVLAVVQAIPSWPRYAVAVACAVSMVFVLAFMTGLRTDTHDNDPEIPAAVAAVAADSRGQLLILNVWGQAWPQTMGFLLQAERTGVRFCVTDPSGTYRVVTEPFRCTASDTGARYTILSPSAVPARGVTPVARFGTPGGGDVTVIPG